MTEEKKDYIINLRLSRATYDKLKDLAKENRETLSNLVRKTIDDGLDIFNDVSTELFGKEIKPENKILHYYEGIIMDEGKCSKCGKKISRGSKVLIGETKKGSKKYICITCFKQTKSKF